MAYYPNCPHPDYRYFGKDFESQKDAEEWCRQQNWKPGRDYRYSVA